MPLALETPQTILMVLSFAAMAVSVGIAIWLWRRHQTASRPVAPRPERRSGAVAVASRNPSAPEPAAAKEDVTEFVALPHLREHDAPRSDPTAVIAVVHGRPTIPDRTEIVAPPGERTEFIPPPTDRTEIVAAPRPAFEPEKTEFIPLPFGRRDEPVPARTESAPTPTPTPTPAPTPAPPTPTEIDLPEHLRLAIDAFEQLQAGGTSPALAGHLDVLANAPATALLELVRPALAREQGLRFAGTLLPLLHAKHWPTKTHFASLLADLDEPRKHIALALLRSWDDPRAETLATASLAAASDLEARLLWLGCLADRGWDPGAAVIEAALADPNPRVVASGLRLVLRCEAAPRLQAKLAGSLFATDPEIRMHAIEAALGLGDPSAWLVCRQLARNPSFPVAAQLVGLLGTEAEIAEQCRAFESAPTPELLAGLGLSGRPVALQVCIDHFDDRDPIIQATARTALTLAAKTNFASADDARAWLRAQTHPRLLGGERRSAAAVLAQLAIADEPTRRALARELRIRSRGRVHLDATLLPHAFAQQLERLRPQVSELDFEQAPGVTRRS